MAREVHELWMDSIIWTQTSSESKLSEIMAILNDKSDIFSKLKSLVREVSGKDNGLIQIKRKLLSFLNSEDYISFQRNIWMNEKECTGKLWEKTLKALKNFLYIQSQIQAQKEWFRIQFYKNVQEDSERENEQSAIISRMINFLSFDPKEKDILSLIKQNLNRTLQEWRYEDFQKKIGMSQTQIDGKIWKLTERRLYEYFSWLEKWIQWTEKSSESKLKEIVYTLKTLDVKVGDPELEDERVYLQMLLQKKDYRGFQRRIGLTWKGIDGMLWEKALTQLNAYLIPYLKPLERSDWHVNSKIIPIKLLLEPDSLDSKELKSEKKKLRDLLKRREYKLFQTMVGLTGKKVDGKLGRSSLDATERYLEKYMDWIPWKMKLVQTDGNWWTYTYMVRTGWTVAQIKNNFRRQFWFSPNALKVMNVKWEEIGEDYVFEWWEKLFIHWPLSVSERVDDAKEKIDLQENYLKKTWKEIRWYKQLLEDYARDKPMKESIELSFGIPVYKYQEIDKTLTSLTTNQIGVDPSKYEIVILLNKPRKEALFDETREKIYEFKYQHPKYNIQVFEHSFDFDLDEEWHPKVLRWTIYKLLWDLIVKRNVMRRNIPWMDLKKIRNLIMKTGWADSTDKNPQYIKNQLEKYQKQYDERELVRLIGDSRIPKEVAMRFPLVEIAEFLQRKFDNIYAWGPLNRNIGIWSYKARWYALTWWFNKTLPSQEDKDLISRIRKDFVARRPDVCMYNDEDFVGAVDNSTDRGIFSMYKGKAYCDRNYDNAEENEIKSREWNTWALENQGKPQTEYLELTRDNLEKNIGAYYNFKINSIFRGKTWSLKYDKYLKNEWKNANEHERRIFIKKEVVDPIMKEVLADRELTWLAENDYILYLDDEGIWRITIRDSAVQKVQETQRRKIAEWYYEYWK